MIPLKLDEDYTKFFKKLLSNGQTVTVPITMKTTDANFVRYHPSIGTATLKEVNNQTLAVEVTLPEPFATSVTNGVNELSLKPRCSGKVTEGKYELSSLDSLEIGLDLE